MVLGSGWAAVSFLKKIDKDRFDVTCISPRNYFLMTPLLPSVTVGTVETRTVVSGGVGPPPPPLLLYCHHLVFTSCQ